MSPDEIARRLSPAQRDVLRRFDANPEASIFDVWAPLAHMQIITRKAGSTDASLTPLGQTVRAIVAKEAGDG